MFRRAETTTGNENRSCHNDQQPEMAAETRNN